MGSLERQENLDRRPWVEPDLTDERVEAGWRAVRDRTAPGPRRRSRAPWIAAGALAAAAAAGLVLWAAGDQQDAAPSAWSDSALETGDEPTSVQLADGSQIEAGARSRLELLEGTATLVRVAVRRGGATFEVARHPDRAFVVEADDVRVTVVGTRFSVRIEEAFDDHLVEVTVTHGRVEVRRGGELQVLGPGDTWRRRRSETVEVTPSVEPEPVEATAEAEVHRPARQKRARAGPESSPAALLDRAASARRAGHARDAASLYEQLVREHPGDGRAPLAALELGRLRMDSLGDPAGAARALERAIALGPRSPLREDAMARLVRAHEAAGAAAACRRARERYLAAFPGGRWAQDVTRRCGGP